MPRINLGGDFVFRGIDTPQVSNDATNKEYVDTKQDLLGDDIFLTHALEYSFEADGSVTPSADGTQLLDLTQPVTVQPGEYMAGLGGRILRNVGLVPLTLDLRAALADADPATAIGAAITTFFSTSYDAGTGTDLPAWRTTEGGVIHPNGTNIFILPDEIVLAHNRLWTNISGAVQIVSEDTVETVYENTALWQEFKRTATFVTDADLTSANDRTIIIEQGEFAIYPDGQAYINATDTERPIIEDGLDLSQTSVHFRRVGGTPEYNSLVAYNEGSLVVDTNNDVWLNISNAGTRGVTPTEASIHWMRLDNIGDRLDVLEDTPTFNGVNLNPNDTVYTTTTLDFADVSATAATGVHTPGVNIRIPTPVNFEVPFLSTFAYNNTAAAYDAEDFATAATLILNENLQRDTYLEGYVEEATSDGAVMTIVWKSTEALRAVDNMEAGVAAYEFASEGAAGLTIGTDTYATVAERISTTVGEGAPDIYENDDGDYFVGGRQLFDLHQFPDENVSSEINRLYDEGYLDIDELRDITFVTDYTYTSSTDFTDARLPDNRAVLTTNVGTFPADLRLYAQFDNTTDQIVDEVTAGDLFYLGTPRDEAQVHLEYVGVGGTDAIAAFGTIGETVLADHSVFEFRILEGNNILNGALYGAQDRLALLRSTNSLFDNFYTRDPIIEPHAIVRNQDDSIEWQPYRPVVTEQGTIPANQSIEDGFAQIDALPVPHQMVLFANGAGQIRFTGDVGPDNTDDNAALAAKVADGTFTLGDGTWNVGNRMIFQQPTVGADGVYTPELEHWSFEITDFLTTGDNTDIFIGRRSGSVNQLFTHGTADGETRVYDLRKDQATQEDLQLFRRVAGGLTSESIHPLIDPNEPLTYPLEILGDVSNSNTELLTMHNLLADNAAPLKVLLTEGIENFAYLDTTGDIQLDVSARAIELAAPSVAADTWTINQVNGLQTAINEGGGRVTIAAAAPTATAAGQLWLNSDTDTLYIARSNDADEIAGGEWEVVSEGHTIFDGGELTQRATLVFNGGIQAADDDDFGGTGVGATVVSLEAHTEATWTTGTNVGVRGISPATLRTVVDARIPDGQADAVWEAGTNTNLHIPSPAQIKLAIEALGGGGGADIAQYPLTYVDAFDVAVGDLYIYGHHLFERTGAGVTIDSQADLDAAAPEQGGLTGWTLIVGPGVYNYGTPATLIADTTTRFWPGDVITIAAADSYADMIGGGLDIIGTIIVANDLVGGTAVLNDARSALALDLPSNEAVGDAARTGFRDAGGLATHYVQGGGIFANFNDGVDGRIAVAPLTDLADTPAVPTTGNQWQVLAYDRTNGVYGYRNESTGTITNTITNNISSSTAVGYRSEVHAGIHYRAKLYQLSDGTDTTFEYNLRARNLADRTVESADGTAIASVAAFALLDLTGVL